jgi:hypothetical protein
MDVAAGRGLHDPSSVVEFGNSSADSVSPEELAHNKKKGTSSTISQEDSYATLTVKRAFILTLIGLLQEEVATIDKKLQWQHPTAAVVGRYAFTVPAAGNAGAAPTSSLRQVYNFFDAEGMDVDGETTTGDEDSDNV